MLAIENNTILYLSPHTDDIEVSCAASLNKFNDPSLKNRIHIVGFSSAKKSLPSQFNSNTTKLEFYKSTTEVLKIRDENITLYDFNVREFPSYRQEILEILVHLNKTINPDIVFCPSLNDTHQDHNTIANEAFRAYKRKTIFGYEIPWNNLHFDYSCFIHISHEDLKIKCEAMSQYLSQKTRLYGGLDFITHLAHVRGSQSGNELAEAFEIIRLNL
jgi:N-acetylglucosamine malate deacetylase 1